VFVGDNGPELSGAPLLLVALTGFVALGMAYLALGWTITRASVASQSKPIGVAAIVGGAPLFLEGFANVALAVAYGLLSYGLITARPAPAVVQT
jgi:hypothetical protein